MSKLKIWLTNPCSNILFPYHICFEPIIAGAQYFDNSTMSDLRSYYHVLGLNWSNLSLMTHRNSQLSLLLYPFFSWHLPYCTSQRNFSTFAYSNNVELCRTWSFSRNLMKLLDLHKYLALHTDIAQVHPLVMVSSLSHLDILLNWTIELTKLNTLYID